MNRNKEQCQYKSTLCWECKHAVPERPYGCSWSVSFVPVPGWDAEEDTITVVEQGEEREVRSYMVNSCPRYIPG